jgi:hypothetical protein
MTSKSQATIQSSALDEQQLSSVQGGFVLAPRPRELPHLPPDFPPLPVFPNPGRPATPPGTIPLDMEKIRKLWADYQRGRPLGWT